MTNDKTHFEGGCSCGDVRYEMSSRPLFVHCCHCRMCQRQTGSAFAVNALIEADRVHVVQGTTETINMSSPSGKGQNIIRCPHCRVALWSNYLGFGGGKGEAVNFMRVGTLDNPDVFPPDAHIYTASKQPWFVLPADAIAVEKYYDTEKTWPKESYERLMVVFDKD